MSEKVKDGRANNGGPRPKVRDDDRRGSKPGEFSIPPFVATDEQRERVKDLARVVNDDQIAFLMGISRDTLHRHFRKEIDIARAGTTAAIGGKLIAAALAGDKASQIFYMKTRGGWSQKHEVSGPGGGPIETRTFDFSRYTAEELNILIPLLDQMITETGGDAQPE